MIAKYLFVNVLGNFVFDEKFSLVDKANSEKELLKKYSNLKKPTQTELKNILHYFKQKKFFLRFHEINLKLTKQKIITEV